MRSSIQSYKMFAFLFSRFHYHYLAQFDFFLIFSFSFQIWTNVSSQATASTVVVRISSAGSTAAVIAATLDQTTTRLVWVSAMK